MDLDGDGKADIISGSWPGEITLFRRDGDGFAGGERLKHEDGKPVNPADGSTVFAFDWDGDGKVDLIIGTAGGDVLFVAERRHPHAAGVRRPEAARGRRQKLEIDVRGDAAPVVADWDGDGMPDLIVGAEDGSVVWHRNIGDVKSPNWARRRLWLREPGCLER